MTDDVPNPCASCGDGTLWPPGPDAPVKLAVDRPGHVAYYRCPICGTYWEETERYRSPLAVAVAEERLAALGATR